MTTDKKGQTLSLVKTIVNLIDDKKAEDIVILEIAGLSVIADYFVICTGRSITQTKAVADHVVDMLKQDHNIQVKGVEGQQDGKWILLDFGEVIVHVFRHEEREFYNLERLWGDANQLQLEKLS